jgi:signal transduction histidine kinase
VAEAGRGSLKLGVVLALAMAALFQLLALAHGVRSHGRLRARVSEAAERRLEAARGALDPVLARGRDGWDEAARLALALGVASEVEVLAPDGAVVFSRPHAAPVAHRPDVSQRRQLDAGRTVTALARDGPELRALTYLRPTAPGDGHLLRLASLAPDLEDESREWRTVLLGHAAALGVLALAVALVLWPRPGGAAEPGQGALTAYEVAMERLRDHGQAQSERHEQATRRMEERLREQEAMARAGELTAGIVHEVRNGLGTIAGYARLVGRRGGEEAPEARAILDECATLETVVRRFNDFVRLEALQLADTDLARLAARVVAREQRGHDAVAVRLIGLDAPLVVSADEELLERALENVVRNAVEAAAAGGRHVTVTGESGERVACLLVDDDGPGLAADHPGAIRPFYTTRPGGLGLGLPLARKIVLLHGGELELSRLEPRGVRVTIRLPREGPPAADLDVTKGSANPA